MTALARDARRTPPNRVEQRKRVPVATKAQAAPFLFSLFGLSVRDIILSYEKPNDSYSL